MLIESRLCLVWITLAKLVRLWERLSRELVSLYKLKHDKQESWREKYRIKSTNQTKKKKAHKLGIDEEDTMETTSERLQI